MIVLSFFLIYLVLYFSPVIFTTKWLWEDFPFIYFPLKQLVMQGWQQGSVPFFNDFILGGQSLIADVAAGIFYPFNVLLTPLWSNSYTFNYWLLELFVIFHLLIALLGMYWLVRRVWRLSRSAAIIAALVFVFSSFFILHLKHVGIVLSGVWLPLIFGNYLLWRSKRKFIYLWNTALFLIFSNLGGHTQIVYYLYLFLGWYLVWSLLEQYFKEDRRVWLREVALEILIMAALMAVGIGAAAVQYLPFWQILSESVRSSSNYGFSSSFSLDFGQYLINLFLPHIFGGYGFGVPYNGRGNYWENVNYLGLVTLVLLAFSWLFFKKEKWIRFGWATALIFLLLAAGDNFFLHFIATKILWGFSKFRAPARLMMVANFAFAFLSAFSLHYLLQLKDEKKEKIRSILKLVKRYGIYFYLFWLAVAFIFWTARWQLGQLGWLEIADFVWLLILGSGLYWLWRVWLSGKVSSSFLTKILISLLAIDLFYFGFMFNQGSADPTLYYAYYPELNYLTKTVKEGERAVLEGVYPVNVGMVRGLAFLNGHHYVFTRRLERLSGGNFHYYLKNDLGLFPNLLTLYNVKYVLQVGEDKNLFKDKLTPLTGVLYENKQVLGPVWLVDKVVVERDEDLLLQKIRTTDLSKEAYLDNFLSLKQQTAEKFDYQLLSYKKSNGQIDFTVESNQPALAIISQSWLPGWQARVAGKPAKVWRVDYNLLGIEVPVGKVEVSLFYQPSVYRWGLIISSAIWLLFLFSGIGYYLARFRRA